MKNQNPLMGSGLIKRKQKHMNVAEAKDKAISLLFSNKAFYEKHQPVILDDKTLVTEFGWVFFYQSYDFIYNKDDRKMLIGNCPIMIDKLLDLVFRAGTQCAIEDYIAIYMKNRGDLNAYEDNIGNLC